MNIDEKGDVTLLSFEIQQAIEPVLRKYNLTKEQVGVTFGNNKVDFKFTIKSNNEDLERNAFETYCHHYGVPSEDFKKIKNIAGVQYMLLGFNPKARKYPLICLDMSRNVKVKMSEVAWNYAK